MDFASLSKGFKTQESYNTYIKVNKTQFIKIIYDNTSSILQCASALEFLFFRIFGIKLYWNCNGTKFLPLLSKILEVSSYPAQ